QGSYLTPWLSTSPANRGHRSNRTRTGGGRGPRALSSALSVLYRRRVDVNHPARVDRLTSSQRICRVRSAVSHAIAPATSCGTCAPRASRHKGPTCVRRSWLERAPSRNGGIVMSEQTLVVSDQTQLPGEL